MIEKMDSHIILSKKVKKRTVGFQRAKDKEIAYTLNGNIPWLTIALTTILDLCDWGEF
ncbi:hypothetical protein SDC9_180895 [bioreactor metagenome]|uniref:Uncharacterized protein n=1 Tax=bioreactor metagenome TaxID=1076179 RepID=A0A645H301_9ZZZZ